MTDTVKLALVGCGGISRAHVRGYGDLFERGCREFEVTACCDVNRESAETRAQEIAAFQGTTPQVFVEVDDLLKAGVAEAADLCLPHCFHHSVAIPLLEAGVHVMLEKPLGITIKASKRIIEAAERSNCVLATGENARRYLTSRSCARALNERRLIGDLRLVTIQLIGYQPFDFTKERGRAKLPNEIVPFCFSFGLPFKVFNSLLHRFHDSLFLAGIQPRPMPLLAEVELQTVGPVAEALHSFTTLGTGELAFQRAEYHRSRDFVPVKHYFL